MSLKVIMFSCESVKGVIGLEGRSFGRLENFK